MTAALIGVARRALVLTLHRSGYTVTAPYGLGSVTVRAWDEVRPEQVERLAPALL